MRRRRPSGWACSDGAAQRLHGAREGDQETVARSLEQPAAVLGGKRLEDLDAQGTHTRQRGRLVRADHGSIADDIGRQNAGQTTIRRVHVYLSMHRTRWI
jgi:hypothetical protein